MKQYIEPEVKVICFHDDIITASGGGCGAAGQNELQETCLVVN